eukprot:12678554-Ditylum_brightwellii.AAC.2
MQHWHSVLARRYPTPCAYGSIAKVCAYSGSILLPDAVWSTEHVRASILLEKSDFHAWQYS